MSIIFTIFYFNTVKFDLDLEVHVVPRETIQIKSAPVSDRQLNYDETYNNTEKNYYETASSKEKLSAVDESIPNKFDDTQNFIEEEKEVSN